MSVRTAAALAVGTSVFCLALGSGPMAQVSDKPLEENWWPSEWGPDDKVGSANRTTPEMVLAALELVKQGKVATLGKLYAGDIPMFGRRAWQMTIPGTPTGGPFGTNALTFHDELVTTEIGQVGTQFDGPGHIGVTTSEGVYFYNGRKIPDVYARGPANVVTGLGDLGVEHVAEKGFVCRGVLLDAPKHRGGPLPIPTEAGSPGIVTADDVKAMVEEQGLDPIKEGDCVFLYTGHGDLWKNSEWPALSAEEKAERRKQFTSGEPGFGLSACEYMAGQGIILTGGDTSANDAQPVSDGPEGAAAPCHTEMQARHGIWNIENLDFSPLLEDGVYEFMFVWAPLKIVGGTGSPGNPVALY
jgi:kynurenine formamidase